MPLAAAGCLAFSAAVAGIGWAVGSSWHTASHDLRYVDYVVVAAALTRGVLDLAKAPPGYPFSAMKIPHVDVQAQYAPLIPELKEAFARTLETGRFIFGPEVEAFEREAADKLGTADTVSCANGTDAIVLVLRAMGIEPQPRPDQPSRAGHR